MTYRVCIVSFSEVRRDGRVLRQIEHLSPRYNVIVIGFGQPDPGWKNVVWIPIHPEATMLSKAFTIILLSLARALPVLYDVWYWARRRHQQAYYAAVASHANVIHANDLNTLPLAVRAAKKLKAKVVFDVHEYAPLELENRWWWRLLFSPMVVYFLRKYATQDVVGATITVCNPIAERYRDEFGFHPVTVINAPKLRADAPTDHVINPARIRLIHHGMAMRDRKIEVMIQALSLSEPRFDLTLMLIDKHEGYVAELKELAERIAPGRVFFRDPVLPAQTVETAAQFDMGFCFIAPTNYNYLVSLPNKFFDFVVAGLAVIIGPSPAMAELVKQYQFGVVSSTFEPQNLADTLNALSVEQIAHMRGAACEAARYLNANAEMAKLESIYQKLLNEGQA
jgi:glycosyltransferase involved in cell wall biosynthesis